MNPFKVGTFAEFENYLRAIGLTKTAQSTATGTFWRSSQNGQHVQVPDGIEGMYPDVLMQAVLSQVVAIGHIPSAPPPTSGLGDQTIN